ncbi:MAG TPA: hypothetical protein VGA78_17640 [Gemmatimonadales bacterium]
MRVFLVYDRRTGEPVSTFEEPDDNLTTGEFTAVHVPPDRRERWAVVEVTTGKAPARRPRKTRKQS